MSDAVRCPDCGQESPAGSANCRHCNYPLGPVEAAPTPPAEPGVVLRRPARPPRRGPAVNAISLNLWLVAGGLAAVALVWTAYTSFRASNSVPVEGASVDQQRVADSLRAVLARDSTDVEANIQVANLLYDTANWAQAATHYARALARDSSRVTALVDLGVCYYNQGEMRQAEELFQRALARDPHQSVALFNLGVVNERAGEDRTAMRYYHRALETAPPEAMRQEIVRRMQSLMQKTGRAVPPMGPGAPPAGSPVR
jgi:tetratricopeptide (TPR) repeat protein